MGMLQEQVQEMGAWEGQRVPACRPVVTVPTVLLLLVPQVAPLLLHLLLHVQQQRRPLGALLVTMSQRVTCCRLC